MFGFCLNEVASFSTNFLSWASLMPFVFRLTVLQPLSYAIPMKSRIRGWIVGSPPEYMHTSGSPSARTNASSAVSTCSIVREKPSGCFVPESAKQIGQSRLQPVFTSMIPRQACCLWSGHRPQSSGQPCSVCVWVSSGSVPGLL